jgi:hypothetical protein
MHIVWMTGLPTGDRCIVDELGVRPAQVGIDDARRPSAISSVRCTRQALIRLTSPLMPCTAMHYTGVIIAFPGEPNAIAADR